MSTSATLTSSSALRVLSPTQLRNTLPHENSELEWLKSNYRHLIASTGEDVERDGLLKTPERAAKAWKFLTSGYQTDPAELLRSAVFDEEYSDMVLVKDIEFYSLCEHHLLPFHGKVHVAYVPDGKIVGLSKVPRMIDVYARRLQVQERMTRQIAESIQEALSPKGVAVWIEAEHMCMMMRGVEKQHSATATSTFRGVFEDDQRLQENFLRGIGGSR